ncbi:MAG TPA: hypothetical protein VHD36_09800 [Pirellulales bacterium]|nr:hypothetical protein [Pirellulales bacterium]
MRKYLACFGLFIVAAMLLPIAAHGAGDASAIRRATRTRDSGWVSNYRPGSTSSSRRYSYSTSNSKKIRATPRPAGCQGKK